MKKILLMVMALTLAFSSGALANVVLVGNNLTVGIDNSGGMVSFLAPPQGITFTGAGATLPNDFTWPGNPWEFYSIGVGGVGAAFGVVNGAVNPGGYVTTNLSAGTNLQATTIGPAFNVGGASLIYTQIVVFDQTSNTINVSATLYNNNNFTINNVVYARGMDPDPDVLSGGGFPTTNTFVPGGVKAVGPTTGMFVTMSDLTVGTAGVASISGGPLWATDPYVLLGGGLVFGAVPGNPFDYSINMAWNIGTMPAGTSFEVDFQYQFGVSPVPIPGSLLLLSTGILGLVGVGIRRKL